jgi:hypothetical protein
MSVKKVRDAINEIAAILGAVGAKTPSKELGALSRVLEGGDDKSVTDFFSELQQRLTRGKAVGASSPKRPTPKKPVAKAEALADQARMDQYVRRLDNAGTDDNGFHAVLSEIRGDKLIRKPEANAIAAAYTKGRLTWPTKREAFEAIEATFRDRAYQAVKMLQVDKASRF